MNEVTINGIRYIPAPDLSETPELLDAEYDFDEVGKVSIRAYLCALLTQLWSNGQSFSGKRPFGNSGWEAELRYALVKAGAVPGDIDEEGDVYACHDADKADRIIYRLIATMCHKAIVQE